MNIWQKYKQLGPKRFYQRAMWYAAATKSELYKPFLLLNEGFIFTTWLSTYIGYRPPKNVVVIIYLLLLVAFIIIGKKWIVEKGIVAYNNNINNLENPQLVDIAKKLDELLNLLKK